VESVDHLIVQCVFSREVWFKVLHRYGWQDLAPGPEDRFVGWWITSQKHVPKGQCKAFDSLIVAVVWSIWLQRNDRTFRSSSPSLAGLVDNVWMTIELSCCARLLDRS
jgi:hypothetical protein